MTDARPTFPFRSLRARLLIPLVATSLLVAILVAIVSASLGLQWGKRSVDEQYSSVERTLRESTFPLTEPVLQLLAELTQSELMTYGDDGGLLHSTIDLDSLPDWILENPWDQSSGKPPIGGGAILEIDSQRYHSYIVARDERVKNNSDPTAKILLFFDHRRVEETSIRAAMLPLATALPTIVLLATVAYYLSSRWISRLQRLQANVQRVAQGNFDSDTSLSSEHDEVGQLEQSVSRMSKELKQLWGVLRQQQSQRVLHQLASGMAHQLRNTLTGARMALELFQRRQVEHEEEIDVALREMQQAEEYIKRLLTVGKGERESDKPASIRDSLVDVKASLAVMANHLGVELDWDIDESLHDRVVRDGATLGAAVSNLGINAIQAGKHVAITFEEREDGRIRIVVADDGAGIREDVATSIFEPLVTTKPEGAGLGLALVKRSAEYLGGEVRWYRRDQRTHFELIVAKFDENWNRKEN
jgi:signal transduction histidine kinase